MVTVVSMGGPAGSAASAPHACSRRGLGRDPPPVYVGVCWPGHPLTPPRSPLAPEPRSVLPSGGNHASSEPAEPASSAGDSARAAAGRGVVRAGCVVVGVAEVAG